jgi:MFS family permease
MNPPTENAPAAETGQQEPRPGNWREALMALIASRIALIQFEARDTARQRARRVLSIIVAAICLFFTWALLVAGGIAAIAAVAGWPWHWLALAAALLHLLMALFLTSGSAKASAPAFPLTRAEFQKDREWIENFHKKPKSNT